MTMGKAKEKSKPQNKSTEGVQKSKDKQAKKKELLQLLRTSMADADEAGEVEKKPKKKQTKISNPVQSEERQDIDSPADDHPFDDELEKLMYKPMPKKDRKVKLDPRFQEIYTNPEYSGVTKDTDERGALKLVKSSKAKRKAKVEEESEDESPESEPEVDSEDEETDLEEELAEASDEDNLVWDQLETPAVEYLDEATRRLCLKHMQWDRVTARDIYVLASSFLPPQGVLQRVTIYPSEEGLAKLPQDERTGPAVIGALDSLAEDAGVTEWPGEGQEQRGSKQTAAALEELEEADLSAPKAKRLNMCRKYEIERLAFFYAILDFDSPESANAVYEAIDGTEYESSGCRIDLYFVEDSRQVDKHLCGLSDEDAWRAMVTTWPESAGQSADDLGSYAPPNFVNNALRHTHQFGLSWDETPAERKQWLESLAEVDDINDDWQEENCPELSRYLAMSDSSDDEEEEEKERKRQLIRSLLQEADKEEEKRKKRQQRGLRKGDDSDSDSDSDSEEEREAGVEEGDEGVMSVDDDEEDEEEEEEEEDLQEGLRGVGRHHHQQDDDDEEDDEEEKAEEDDDDEEEVEEEPMEASGDESNFFKIVAEMRKQKATKKQKKANGNIVEEKDDDFGMRFCAEAKETKKEKAGSSKKGGMKPTEDAEKSGKRKRKRLSKMQKAKQKMKEKEGPVDPELTLLMSNFKRTTKTSKEPNSNAVAEDPRFASILKDPKFAKDPASLVRLSSRL